MESPTKPEALARVLCFAFGVALGGWISAANSHKEAIAPEQRDSYTLTVAGGYPVLLKTNTGEVFIMNSPSKQWISLPVPMSIPEYQFINMPPAAAPTVSGTR